MSLTTTEVVAKSVTSKIIGQPQIAGWGVAAVRGALDVPHALSEISGFAADFLVKTRGRG